MVNMYVIKRDIILNYMSLPTLWRGHNKYGWMTCDFTSFLTVFQSYQDDVRLIMKGCVQWNSVTVENIITLSED